MADILEEDSDSRLLLIGDMPYSESYEGVELSFEIGREAQVSEISASIDSEDR